ncbi:MAG TPA: threonine ammonia-lyase [Thermodesulfobacteriota bacterium]|nr:threonine ammonia-lyase [Thermodesulfobacteriota bacterium]
MVSVNDVQRAHESIKSFIHKTPLIYSHSLSKLTKTEIYLKAENLQRTGSFKVRGALNKMINIKGKKVITASMGNHAQGVAFAASRLGKHAKVVMPVTAPIVKEEATRNYGAQVVLYGESFKEALNYALSDKEHTFIHAFDDDEVIAGQGTIGIEISEDLKDIDVVLVPIGGGGLISGISVALKAIFPKTEIIGVQTESAISAYLSLRNREVSEMLPLHTLADGIAVGRVGSRTFDIINTYVDDIVLVHEDSIAKAILLFLEREKTVVEGAGAVPLAALLDDEERFRGKCVVLVVSGGNIDFTIIDRIIYKGLVTSGRIGVFEVTVEDIPGSLHSLTGIIASHRGNILNVVHDRIARDLSVGETRVIFTVETRGKEHLDEILFDLREKGFELKDRTGG